MIRYTDEQIINALKLAKISGASASAKEFGFREPTIRAWAKKAEIKLPSTPYTRRDWASITARV